jgi:hypothetical protein
LGDGRYKEPAVMGLITFSINLTLDGCVDHREGIADDETHAFFIRLMDESGAMLWGRITYDTARPCTRPGCPERDGSTARSGHASERNRKHRTWPAKRRLNRCRGAAVSPPTAHARDG